MGMSFGILTLFFYALYPWEWGILDDTPFLRQVRGLVQQYGLFEGVLRKIQQFAHEDRNYGILRPLFWIYTAIIYLWPAKLAYFIRFVMFLVIILCPLFLNKKHSNPTTLSTFFLALCILSNVALYNGLFVISLQEYLGLLFVSIGTVLMFKQNRFIPQNFLCGICFFLATTSKPVFVAVLFSYSLLLFYKKNFVRGLFWFLVSIVWILLSAYWSQTGGYAQEIYQFTFERFWKTIFHFCKLAFVPSIVVCSYLYLLGVPLKKIASFKNLDGMALSSLFWIVSGLFYLILFLPRGVGHGVGYYFAPPIYLIFTGILLYTQASGFYPKKNLPLLAINCILALSIPTYALTQGFAREISIRKVRDWMLTLPKQGLHIAANGEHIQLCFNDLMILNLGSEWKNQMSSLVEAGQKPESLPDYYIIFKRHSRPLTSAMYEKIFSFPAAEVYKSKKKSMK